MQTNTAPLFRKTAETFAAGAKTLPQKYFVSAEVFSQEQAKIFSQHWLLVGHQSQIAQPGDYFLLSVPPSSDYGAIEESLIVIRDKSGEIHGFFNVCRHRGTRLCEEKNGHLSAIQCPYHAWTYALDGRLIGAPHMDEVPGFDKADFPLHPVNLGLWEGFIFVNLEKSRMPLEKWFAPLGRIHFREPRGRGDPPSLRSYGAARSGRFHLPGAMVRAVGREVFALEHGDLALGEKD
jgi:Rieske 2Fe-2S family protein